MMIFSNQNLKKLIIPLILEQALAITVGMADTMMISSVGEAAVSGVSLVDMFNNLIISILAALATGGAVVTSQFIGASSQEEACRSAKQLLWVNALITIVDAQCDSLLDHLCDVIPVSCCLQCLWGVVSIHGEFADYIEGVRSDEHHQRRW